MVEEILHCEFFPFHARWFPPSSHGRFIFLTSSLSLQIRCQPSIIPAHASAPGLRRICSLLLCPGVSSSCWHCGSWVCGVGQNASVSELEVLGLG